MKILRLEPLLKPIHARIKIPGSKSYTLRALFIAAMCSSPVKIINPLVSDDTKAMTRCLKTLGIKKRSYNLDAHLSGATIRFILALATVTAGTKAIYGKEGLNKRPIGELVLALTQLGAKIKYLGKIGYPPVKVLSSKLHPGTVKIKGSISSQYISAILMVAPLIGEVTIEVIGNQVSKPYIDMTIDIMKHFGVEVSNTNFKKYQVYPNQKYHAKEYTVEADYSSAAYSLAIAALTKSTITLKNVNPKSKQADMRFMRILEDMGNKIQYEKNQITIIGEGIKPVSVDMDNCPDQIQTLAVLAAFAKGVTSISGISNLRIKETDRVFAIRKELKKMGIKTTATKNILTIYGGKPQAAHIETYGDHRMAMAFAVAGAKLAGMEIVDPDVVNKTFPDFWKKLNSIGIMSQILEKNIVLIGMRGSGKTTVAKILARKLTKEYLELDDMIVKKTGLTIPKIVEKHGWGYFRKKESEIIKEIASHSGKIITTGGGMVTKDENIKALKKNGIIVLLRARVETLLKRLSEDSHRPPLTNKKTQKEEIEEVLKQREQQYKKAADKIIDTDNLTPEQIANLILSSIGRIKVCMVIGNPIKQSLSPKMHNSGYRALGIENQFIYLAEKVAKKNLKSVLEKARALKIRGISVTVPHKQNAIKYLNEIDPVAKKIGAVNTIVNDHGKLTGFNTDYIGAIAVLEKKTNLKGKQIAVIGAGGAARAIVYGLVKKGAAVKIFNRSLEEGEHLAKDFGCKYDSFSSLEEISKMSIIINATSVGMNEDKSLIDKNLLNKNQIVFDVVYTPKETRLIKDAKEKGAQVIYGYEMLLYQAVEQFKLYTGRNAPVGEMREALIKSLGR